MFTIISLILLVDMYFYQLENIRPLYSRVVFISNSQLPEDVKSNLVAQHLVDDILERQNSGFDFAAWRDGMKTVGFDQLAHFDSVTLMNDTCFGPLWDLEPIYQNLRMMMRLISGNDQLPERQGF